MLKTLFATVATLLAADNKPTFTPETTIFDFSVDNASLSDYKGKNAYLLVNVASE